MYPHRIRLRGPWEYEPWPMRGDGHSPRRMTMPRRWKDGGLAGYSGTVWFRRRFGYPGRLDSYERVWLTFAGIEGTAEISLNGQALGRFTETPIELDVTALLGKRNELVVLVSSESDAGGLWGDVALDIRCSAYLRGTRAWRERDRLHVEGEVVGTSDRPLEVYVLADRHSIGYAAIEPDPAGKPYHIAAEMPDPPPNNVRVDLVNLAEIWYAVEVPVT